MTQSPAIYVAQGVVIATSLVLIVLAIVKLVIFVREQGCKLTVSQIAFYVEILGNLRAPAAASSHCRDSSSAHRV